MAEKPKWMIGLDAWNTGTHDNPSYCAGSTAFACDVQDLLQSHAALLTALEHAIVDVGCVADRLALGSPMRNTLEGFVIEARTALAKAGA